MGRAGGSQLPTCIAQRVVGASALPGTMGGGSSRGCGRCGAQRDGAHDTASSRSTARMRREAISSAITRCPPSAGWELHKGVGVGGRGWGGEWLGGCGGGGVGRGLGGGGVLGLGGESCARQGRGTQRARPAEARAEDQAEAQEGGMRRASSTAHASPPGAGPGGWDARWQASSACRCAPSLNRSTVDRCGRGGGARAAPTRWGTCLLWLDRIKPTSKPQTKKESKKHSRQSAPVIVKVCVALLGLCHGDGLAAHGHLVLIKHLVGLRQGGPAGGEKGHSRTAAEAGGTVWRGKQDRQAQHAAQREAHAGTGAATRRRRGHSGWWAAARAGSGLLRGLALHGSCIPAAAQHISARPPCCSRQSLQRAARSGAATLPHRPNRALP